MKFETKIIIILIIIFFIYTGMGIYQFAVERECGWNLINHIKAKELWCVCDPTPNLDNNDSGFYYGGFSCMNCERFCEKYNLGTKVLQEWEKE